MSAQGDEGEEREENEALKGEERRVKTRMERKGRGAWRTGQR